MSGSWERILAAQLTAYYGREKIVEWYLNSANYGHFAYGADAAARLYFSKPASQLNLAESALLAAVSQAPAINPLDAPQAAIQFLMSAPDWQRALVGVLAVVPAAWAERVCPRLAHHPTIVAIVLDPEEHSGAAPAATSPSASLWGRPVVSREQVAGLPVLHEGTV